MRDNTESAVFDRKAWGDFPPLYAFVLLLTTLIGLYICYLLMVPFISALAWALAIAVLAAPVHRRLESRLRNPNLAAATSVIVLALVVIIPLMVMGQLLVGELSSGVEALQKQFGEGELQRKLESRPLLARATEMIRRHIDLESVFGNVAGSVTNLGGSIVKGSFAHIATVMLTFYLLFYFLRDRRDALHHVNRMSPLTRPEMDQLFTRVSDTIHAVIFGTVVAAAAQGALGGLLFWMLGLPNPIFWGLVMALLAVVPVLGAFVVWIPAAVYLALSGEWGKAAILTAAGIAVIGGVDNILHPVLAGGRLRLHTIPMFISIVGGLILFGASGLILGPLALTLTMALLEIWRARTSPNAQEDSGAHQDDYMRSRVRGTAPADQ